MISIQVAGGMAQTMAVAAGVKFIARATSLGGAESLIEPSCLGRRPDSPTPANLLRISVGLEHPDDLIADLGRALKG